MKKLIFILIGLLMLTPVLAQELSIQLIEYHPETYYTRLQIGNNAGRDLNDINIKVGENFETSSSGIFKQDALYNAILNIPPGEHLVTVTTSEGVTTSKIIYFSLSKKAIQESREVDQTAVAKEAELARIAAENKARVEQKIQQETERAIELGILEPPKERSFNTLLIVAIIVIITGIIGLYWLLQKQGTKK